MNHLPTFDQYLTEKLGGLHSMVVYHGTNRDFDKFELSHIDGGIHFGTREQAMMRGSKYLFEVQISIDKPIRYTDCGGEWKAKIAAAKRSKKDGIVYLNRYEGIPYERFQMLSENGYGTDRLDRLPDSKFYRLVPEAEDSYIVFDPKYIRILNRFTL